MTPAVLEVKVVDVERVAAAKREVGADEPGGSLMAPTTIPSVLEEAFCMLLNSVLL